MRKASSSPKRIRIKLPKLVYSTEKRKELLRTIQQKLETNPCPAPTLNLTPKNSKTVLQIRLPINPISTCTNTITDMNNHKECGTATESENILQSTGLFWSNFPNHKRNSESVKKVQTVVLSSGRKMQFKEQNKSEITKKLSSNKMVAFKDMKKSISLPKISCTNVISDETLDIINMQYKPIKREIPIKSKLQIPAKLIEPKTEKNAMQIYFADLAKGESNKSIQKEYSFDSLKQRSQSCANSPKKRAGALILSRRNRIKNIKRDLLEKPKSSYYSENYALKAFSIKNQKEGHFPISTLLDSKPKFSKESLEKNLNSEIQDFDTFNEKYEQLKSEDLKMKEYFGPTPVPEDLNSDDCESQKNDQENTKEHWELIIEEKEKNASCARSKRFLDRLKFSTNDLAKLAKIKIKPMSYDFQ